jgi:hypothetical protein
MRANPPLDADYGVLGALLGTRRIVQIFGRCRGRRLGHRRAWRNGCRFRRGLSIASSGGGLRRRRMGWSRGCGCGRGFRRTMGRRNRRFGSSRDRRAGHGTVWVEQMIVVRTQSQLNQGARIGNFFGLPAVVALISAHGIFAGLVPNSCSFAVQVMFADQRFLNRRRPARVDLLLAAHALRFRSS